MKENQRREDPYEKGFADKLYDGYIGKPPVDPYEQNRSSSVQKSPQKKHPKKRKKHGLKIFLGVIVFLVALVMLGVVLLWNMTTQPMADGAGHADGSSTILLAGTDESGLHTDTLMLVNCNRNSGQISIMSIPRDTRVLSRYTPHKINGAYSANGCGEEGMYWLCDYVRQCVGFVPDGYVLVDLDAFIELVDLFGGVDYDVPVSMHYEDPTQDLYIHLEPGMQHLNGKQAMGLVRFRKGYAQQDLERVNVQRNFIMTSLKQWMSLGNVPKFFDALEIMERYCLTDLSKSNLMWLAQSVLLCGTDDMMMTTIPHYQDSMYVYIRCDDAYLELLNTYFNPYEKKITYEDLNIAK